MTIPMFLHSPCSHRFVCEITHTETTEKRVNKNNTLCVSVPLWQKNLIIFQLDVHTISREANGVKKLPIGIQTFSEIISENYYYVDKTKILSELTEKGKYYFLSRPRRFGKSLFLDTIKEAFEGNEKLFQGLYLEHNWNWSKKHPVIRIDFGGGVLRNAEELEQRIREILRSNAKRHQIDKIENSSVSGTFEELIQILSQKYSQKVVVLVDEYDKPILDNITNKNVARDMRDGLRNLYSAIKGADAFVKFVFITGVSKFSKVNLFSGLNNLEDITINPNSATICGYTHEELTSVFGEFLVDTNLEELRLWYNGYNFLGDKVYNPFDILLYLKNQVFKNYWFETGNPGFLIELIQENNYNTINMEHIQVTEEQMGAFDVESIELEVLLFQTGYLTIQKKERFQEEIIYTLAFPNMEVKKSLTSVILSSLSGIGSRVNKIKISVYETLSKNDLQGLKNIFYSFFASIPHDWYRKNTLANFEGYYASIFYCYFTALGLDVRTEDVTNHGQVDMTLFFQNKVYVLEFKVIELTETGSALSQIKEKKYYEKYLSSAANEIYLIGVEFSRDNRNIVNYEYEVVTL